jgi:hypothetical protein
VVVSEKLWDEIKTIEFIVSRRYLQMAIENILRRKTQRKEVDVASENGRLRWHGCVEDIKWITLL